MDTEERIKALEDRLAEVEDDLAFAVAATANFQRASFAERARLTEIAGRYRSAEGPPSMIGSKRRAA